MIAILFLRRAIGGYFARLVYNGFKPSARWVDCSGWACMYTYHILVERKEKKNDASSKKLLASIKEKGPLGKVR